MSNPYFKFKRFTVWHDRCAMKVGTDGVLLGAWTPVDGCRHALDVGTGTGLIALQLAQRSSRLHVVGVEIDKEAAAQASENVSRSPWGERIEVVCQNFGLYEPEEKFDLIVSNPPYFVDALKCPDGQRRVARHAGELNYELLVRHSDRLLTADGLLCLILPAEAEDEVTGLAWHRRLYPCRRLRLFTKPGKPCRRVLLAFGRHPGTCLDETLCIESCSGEYTPEYRLLTQDFYLKM